jgi:hypothetical protein
MATEGRVRVSLGRAARAALLRLRLTHHDSSAHVFDPPPPVTMDSGHFLCPLMMMTLMMDITVIGEGTPTLLGTSPPRTNVHTNSRAWAHPHVPYRSSKQAEAFLSFFLGLRVAGNRLVVATAPRNFGMPNAWAQCFCFHDFELIFWSRMVL